MIYISIVTTVNESRSFSAARCNRQALVNYHYDINNQQQQHKNQIRATDIGIE